METKSSELNPNYVGHYRIRNLTLHLTRKRWHVKRSYRTSAGNCLWWDLILVGIYWDNSYYHKGLETIRSEGHFWSRTKHHMRNPSLEFWLTDNSVTSHADNEPLNIEDNQKNQFLVIVPFFSSLDAEFINEDCQDSLGTSGFWQHPCKVFVAPLLYLSLRISIDGYMYIYNWNQTFMSPS